MIFLSLFAAGSLLAGEAPAVQVMQVLPGEKRPALLEPKERNPFIRRETKAAEVFVETESEESKLRALLKTMSVSGIIRGGGSSKALLQNIILKEGNALPPFFQGQVEQLVVARIGEKEIELHFVESDENIKPRKILIPIELRPRKTGQIISVPQPPSSNEDRTDSGAEPGGEP